MLFAEAIILPKNVISLHLVTLDFYFCVSAYKDEMITYIIQVRQRVTCKTFYFNFSDTFINEFEVDIFFYI